MTMARYEFPGADPSIKAYSLMHMSYFVGEFFVRLSRRDERVSRLHYLRGT